MQHQEVVGEVTVQHMNTFRLLARKAAGSGTTTGARLGRLQLLETQHAIATPNFIAPTSRGLVPHLSPDNLQENTSIKGLYVPLEDFIEKAPQKIPPLNAFSGTLRDFVSVPDSKFIVLASRRCPPVTSPQPNSDASIAILTSVGFRDLPVVDYIEAVKQLQPDIVVGIADIPHINPPGKSRWPKMPFRTELWLNELLDRVGESNETAIFAPVLPMPAEAQQQYLNYLVDNVERLHGLAFYEPAIIVDMPDELKHLPALSLDAADGPHMILDEISYGIDIFNISFAAAATDAGIALAFMFGGTDNGDGGKALGIDMWGTEWALDLSPLREGCDCYACIRHHRAYIQHCLSAKEMTAWVLLQIHNTRVVEEFFTAMRTSIEDGTFEECRQAFECSYQRALPEKTGQGPRVRGYQFKSIGGDAKKNKSAFRTLDSGHVGEDEALLPDAAASGSSELEEKGFAGKT